MCLFFWLLSGDCFLVFGCISVGVEFFVFVRCLFLLMMIFGMIFLVILIFWGLVFLCDEEDVVSGLVVRCCGWSICFCCCDMLICWWIEFFIVLCNVFWVLFFVFFFVFCVEFGVEECECGVLVLLVVLVSDVLEIICYFGLFFWRVGRGFVL